MPDRVLERSHVIPVEAQRRLERGSLLVYRPPFGFTDVQLAGPYRRWDHTHRLRPVDGGTQIYDHVVYRLPYEPLQTEARLR